MMSALFNLVLTVLLCVIGIVFTYNLDVRPASHLSTMDVERLSKVGKDLGLDGQALIDFIARERDIEKEAKADKEKAARDERAHQLELKRQEKEILEMKLLLQKTTDEGEFHFWKIDALCRGYLMRKAERKRLLQKDWIRCYIVISATLVLLFKDSEQLNSKPLEYTTLSPGDSITVRVETNEKHKFCFAIKTAHKDDKDWVFSASNPDERTMWVAAFEAIFDFMKYGRIKNWSLKTLEKEKSFMRGPQKEDDEGTLTHDYTDISDEEIWTDDEGLYDPVQPVGKHLEQRDETDLSEMKLSILAGKFGYRWKAFAREELLLSQSEIECIEGKNKNDLKEQMFDVLLLWRRKQIEPNPKAKLIALLKSSQYCDPEAWLCLEKPDSYGCGYVTLKKGLTKECSSHPYNDVTPRKQTMQPMPYYSRTLYATNTPNQVTGKTPTSNGQSPVKKDTQGRKPNRGTQSSYGADNKIWNDVTAELKEKNQKRASTQWNKTNR